MKKVNELEKSLKKRIGKHRLIMAMAIVTGIITIAVFGVLFANSKKTLILGFSQPPITRVTYNNYSPQAFFRSRFPSRRLRCF